MWYYLYVVVLDEENVYDARIVFDFLVFVTVFILSFIFFLTHYVCL